MKYFGRLSGLSGIAISLLFAPEIRAQNGCNMMVDAGPDVTICEGESTTLDGQVSGGNNPEYLWTPAAGLSNPNILNPVASPTSTTTYTLTATAMSGNLITNGGFETGSIAPATTNYTQVADPLAIATNAPNYYGILSVPQIVQAFGCQPDIGNYTMVIHGSTGVNVDFWCQSIPVSPNTDYKFTFKVFGIPYFFAPAPVIVLKVNGTTVGSLQAPNGLCNEANANFTWNSGGATTADVCFANSTVAGLGSMCAIDDITMVECCAVSDEVTVTVAPNVEEVQDHVICEGGSVEVGGQFFQDAGQYEVVLDNYLGCDSTITVNVEVAEVEPYITISNPLTCLLNQSVLDGSLSTGTFGIQSWLWTTPDGNIVSNPGLPSVTVNAAGTYVLTVTTSNGIVTCSNATSVIVALDTVSPVFLLDPAPVAGCEDSIFVLSAQPVDVPANAIIAWTSPNGIILSGGNSYTPTVQGTGTYTLTITNPGNGCTSSESLDILGGGDVPQAQILQVPAITCRDTQGLIVVQIIQPDTGYILHWTTSAGNILGGGDTLTPLVNQGGTYTLTVTDTLTGCTGSLSVTVPASTEIPAITLTIPDTFTCLTDSLLLQAQIPPGPDSLAIQWTTSNGLLLSGAQSLGLWAGGPGTYHLQVEDLRNGCRDTASVLVVADANLPAANAGPDLAIDCGTASVSPQTAGTTQGPGISYQWTTGGGMISNDTLLQPVFSAAGWYLLQVINSLNGCRATDTLWVQLNGDVPAIQIAWPDTLNCLEAQVTLAADVTATGAVALSWTGPAGGIAAGGQTLMPQVILPGWFVLTAVDTTNQCVAMDSVLVIRDTVAPVPVIAAPGVLDCNTPQITLDATGSLPAGMVEYLWTTPDGQIVSGSAGPSPVVNAGGTYTLTLTHTGNGCTAVQAVVVMQDPDLPQVAVDLPDTLTCERTEVVLSASANPLPPGSTLLWTTSDGSLAGPADSLVTRVAAPGTYTLTLTLAGGGCTAMAGVTVVQDTFLPGVVIQGLAPLTCTHTMLSLEAMTPGFGGALLYTWTDPGGSVVGQQAVQSVVTPGQYLLSWLLPTNGCSGSTPVLVVSDTQPPVADAGPDQTLPCSGGQAVLDGSGSTGQGGLTYAWTAITGSLTGAPDLQTATASGPGSYVLSVTDAFNGCTDADTVQVAAVGQGSHSFDLAAPPCAGASGRLTLLPGSGGTPPYTMTVDGLTGAFMPGQAAALVAGAWNVRITDGSGCVFDTLIVMPQGTQLALTVPAQIHVSAGDETTVTLTGGFQPGGVGQVIWTPDRFLSPTANPLVWIIRPEEDITYQVTVTTQEGCKAMASIQVLVNDLRRLYVPNAFSPNNVDGINDLFFPYSGEGGFDRIRSMDIYDRWGNHLFRQEDFPVSDADYGWDGTWRGRKLDPGVYVWVIEVDTGGGGTRLYRGDVTLF